MCPIPVGLARSIAQNRAAFNNGERGSTTTRRTARQTGEVPPGWHQMTLDEAIEQAEREAAERAKAETAAEGIKS